MTTLYTVDDLHKLHDVSNDTIYDWLRSGELRGFKLGIAWRIHPDDWDEFIARRRGLVSMHPAPVSGATLPNAAAPDTPTRRRVSREPRGGS